MKALTMEEASELVTSLGMRSMAETGHFTGLELDNARVALHKLSETYSAHVKGDSAMRRRCLCAMCAAYRSLEDMVEERETVENDEL